MKITFAICLLIAIIFGESHQACLYENNNQFSKSSYSILYAGQQDFSLALLNAINKLMPHENLFFSPYSTYHALLIAYFISGNATENYLKKALRLSETEVSENI